MLRIATIGCILLSLFAACNPGKADETIMNYNYGTEDSAGITTSIKEQSTKFWPSSFGFGKKASVEKIEAWDIDVRPDGKGLPPGEGTVQAGRSIYLAKCISCHGSGGTGGSGGRLLGIKGDTTRAKAIGNYWPYSSTLFDYVRRAMPFNAPGTLKDEEVYSLSAYLLHINMIIDSTTIMNKITLPKVRMPAQPSFIVDDRRGGPEVR